MNIIQKHPVNNLGYNFVEKKYLPKGKDEYHLRNIQNQNGIKYRKLTAQEIESLIRNRNTSDDWNKILVSKNFNPIVATAAPEYAKSNPQNSEIESNKVKKIAKASPINVY